MSDRAGTGQRGQARLQQAAEPDLEGDLPTDDGLDRLLGDQELLMRLQLSSYAPREWLPVAQEFARYGLGVLQPWIGTGKVFVKVRERTPARPALTPSALAGRGQSVAHRQQHLLHAGIVGGDVVELADARGTRVVSVDGSYWTSGAGLSPPPGSWTTSSERLRAGA
jgi:hypothetical protein